MPKLRKRGRPRLRMTRGKKQKRQIPDLVTGLWVIALPDDLLLNKEGDAFVADLYQVMTFKSKVLARIELKQLIAGAATKLEDDPGFTDRVSARFWDDLNRATVEPFKIFAAMAYSFDSNNKLQAAIVPWNEKVSIAKAVAEARREHVSLVKAVENDLKEFMEMIKPDHKAILKQLTAAKRSLTETDRKLSSYL